MSTPTRYRGQIITFNQHIKDGGLVFNFTAPTGPDGLANPFYKVTDLPESIRADPMDKRITFEVRKSPSGAGYDVINVELAQ